MSKREKIILGVTALVVFVGLYILLLAPGSTTGNPAVKDKQVPSNEVAGKIGEDMKKEALSKTETFILSKVNAEWAQDPFLGKPLPHPKEGGEPKTAQAPEIKLTYSGYIMAGNKALAIINGIEYQTGDDLEQGNCNVVSIDAEKVVLQPKGKRGVIIVPFLE